MKRLRYVRAACAIAAFVVAAAGTTLRAQYGIPADKIAGNGLKTDFVKTGLYVISGAGGNSVLRLSGNGLILVNGKLPGSYDNLLKQVTRISDQPIRAVVITNYRANYTGTNDKFLEARTGIIAQQNVKRDFAAYDPPDVKVVPPSFTYDRQYALRLGGIEARLLHFGKAVTAADTVVYFPNLKAVAVGDLFAAVPDPDFKAGGSLVGWGPTLGEVLKLDFDVAIPGSGPAVSKSDLAAFKTKIETLVSRASALSKKGVPKNEFMAELKTDDLGWRLNFTPDQVDAFYAELKAR